MDELYIGVIVGAIVTFIVFRIFGKKIIKPKESVKNREMVVAKDDANDNIPRNLGYIFMAIGAASIGSAVIWGIIDPRSMGPMLPFMIGAPAFLLGLILFIGFYIQKRRARNTESPKDTSG